MSASSSTIRIVGLAAKRRSEPDSTTGVLRADYRCVNSRFRATLSRPAATSKLSRGHALEDELHLEAHVVTVAQRAEELVVLEGEESGAELARLLVPAAGADDQD